jgi:hypothetical protein
VSECDLETSTIRRPRPIGDVKTWKIKKEFSNLRTKCIITNLKLFISVIHNNRAEVFTYPRQPVINRAIVRTYTRHPVIAPLQNN